MDENGRKKWPLSLALSFAAVIMLAVALVAPGLETQIRSENSDSIVIVPLQLGRDDYGIAMVDKDAKTLWVYAIGTRGPAHNKLKLIAARSWEHDRKLKDFNTGEPKPEQVRKLLLKHAKQDRILKLKPEQKEELKQEALPEDL